MALVHRLHCGTASRVSQIHDPEVVWSSPALALVKYIPGPNLANGEFSTNSQNETLRDFKGGIHIDANSRWGKISGYYGIDDYPSPILTPSRRGAQRFPDSPLSPMAARRLVPSRIPRPSAPER